MKTAVPARYGNSFRLELNRELYEGVRFGWIHVRSLRKPAVIRNVRLICQTKPVNYEGWFDCNDPQLTRIWYTGAYTVRLNLLKDYFGAILMERSDRHSWTGDAYTAQAAALAAFGNFPFIRKNLLYTSPPAPPSPRAGESPRPSSRTTLRCGRSSGIIWGRCARTSCSCTRLAASSSAAA